MFRHDNVTFREYIQSLKPSIVYHNTSMNFVTFTRSAVNITSYVDKVREFSNTVVLHLTGLIGTASYSDMQKIRIIGYFFENKLYWQFEVRLFLFTVCIYV
jgi:hypothetical protein